MTSHCRQLLAVAAAMVSVMFLWRPAGAVEYTVGGPAGWGIGTNYDAWAEARSFAAGDVLVFKYVKKQHDVYEVTEEAYRTCDPTGAGVIFSTYHSGLDRVVLPEANKTYWFLCQVGNHCAAGMRLAVKVSLAGAPVGSPPTVDLPPSPSPSPLASAAASQSWMAWGGLVLLGGVAHVLVN